ncbi:hypothetical protein NAT51_18615 [Flavobacterium amniphilum]|uniref:c-type cytochrome n=1 Tax=Flavobacterium amniphilum TaxID=1834035 RepID=UPI00202A967B|nr:hypothetical protein [Flavobacterium amniphilum]MCL9807543.1 hypothetical protein [Flavobacterium amniphilum]
MKKSKWTALAVIGIILYACAPKVVTPPAPKEVIADEPVKKTEPVKAVLAEGTKEVTMTPELAEGKALYENKCGNCHKLFAASKHDKDGWEQTMYYMAPKAKLTEDQKRLVYNYLVAGL